MTFPLLRLPYVAIKEILRMMDFRHLFLLSLCSKRTQVAVKHYQDRSIKLELHVLADNGTIQVKLFHDKNDGDLVVSVRDMSGFPPIGWRHAEFPGVLFQEEQFGLKQCYCENVEWTTMSLLEHLSDLFSVPINSVTLGQNLMWILEWVERRQGPRSYEAIVTSQTISDHQLWHLLVDLNPRTLELHAQPASAHFFIEGFYKTYEHFKLVHGAWFTIDNLITLDCNQIQLHHPTFTIDEINRFFRHVLLGGATSMVFCGFVNSGDHDAVLDGVREVLAPIPGETQFESHTASWKFSGMIEGGDRAVFVSINCSRDVQHLICLNVWEE